MEAIEKTYKISDLGLEMELSSGWFAKQASGSVLLKCKEAIILSTATMAKEPREGQNFLPLTVEYREKFYAAGKIPGGFFKREGKPREKEVLISRLIDRPLRPLFPNKFFNEIQVITQVLSYDPAVLPDVLAIIASSAALMISEVPLAQPVSAVRIGRVNGDFIVNPAMTELAQSDIDLIVAGTESAVLMIEGVSKFVKEDDMIAAVAFAHDRIKKICAVQMKMTQEIGKDKYQFEPPIIDKEFVELIERKAKDSLVDACFISDKQMRSESIGLIEKGIIQEYADQDDHKIMMIKEILHDYEKRIIREAIIKEGKRIDGRSVTDVRDIDIRLGVLPRAHGSALFTRGQTQSLGVVTLGTNVDVQRTDDLEGEATKRFMLHYNFPPFSVGEVGRNIGPGRREIGHGNLAERALENIIPDSATFPYTIRLVSDILESNGSSSMASVCSGCLAMAQAGVPVKATVAGVAMGMILENSEQYAILTDITGNEDHLGDMDFKVAGSSEGITSFQMDIKVEGITVEIMSKALEQALQARLFIIDKMDRALPKPADDLSHYAPRITTIQIKQDKIGDLIGPGGRNIRAIIDEAKVEINIEDSGVVTIAAFNQESSNKALELINASVEELQVGRIYEGKVKRVMEYGAFIEVAPGKEGLCHISKLGRERVKQVKDVVKEGDIVKVKVLAVDRNGRVDLSRRDAMD